MYFVATNHIEYFDRAVTRSERFDAILYIGPPSLETKKARLQKILAERYQTKADFDPGLTQRIFEDSMPKDLGEKIEKAKTRYECETLKATSLPDEFVLSKFALLRWDELDELAAQLSPLLTDSSVITADILRKGLKTINDSKSRTLAEYYRFLSDFKYERYDVSKTAVWAVIKPEDSEIDPPPPVERIGEKLVLKAPVGPVPLIKVPGYKVEKAERGSVRIIKDRDKA